ncbi:hypothetical protein BDQ17DRAFT_797149 [Cyathus striatus]|nr:hypothetical protein BDQ17DRAFT_797149 [Cyathus striatus]
MAADPQGYESRITSTAEHGQPISSKSTTDGSPALERKRKEESGSRSTYRKDVGSRRGNPDINLESLFSSHLMAGTFTTQDDSFSSSKCSDDDTLVLERVTGKENLSSILGFSKTPPEKKKGMDENVQNILNILETELNNLMVKRSKSETYTSCGGNKHGAKHKSTSSSEEIGGRAGHVKRTAQRDRLLPEDVKTKLLQDTRARRIR